MANMVIPNEGKILWEYWALCSPGTDLEEFVIDLYQNNYTPVDGSSAGNFTVATFPGYAQVALLRANFSAPSITANVAYTQYSSAPDFSCTGGGGQLVYGWYMRGATSGKVLAAQAFAIARNMTPGASESINPLQFALKSFA